MVLLRSQKTEKFYLPSTTDKDEAERAWVELKTVFLAAESVDVAMASIPSKPQRTLAVIASLITDWNLEVLNDDGEAVKAPIDYEHVARMEPDDTAFLSQQIRKAQDENVATTIDDDQKKTSSDTSLESQTQEVAI